MSGPSTVGILLREVSFGHANQLAAMARAHLIALAARTQLLAGKRWGELRLEAEGSCDRTVLGLVTPVIAAGVPRPPRPLG